MSRAREQRSLFGEILDWMLAPLLLLWPISVVLTWLVAQGIANKPFDRQLGETAQAVARQIAAQMKQPGRNYELPMSAADMLRREAPDRLWFQVRRADGGWLAGERTLPPPADEDRGTGTDTHFRDESVGVEPVRVAYLWIEVPTFLDGAAPVARAADRPAMAHAEAIRPEAALTTESRSDMAPPASAPPAMARSGSAQGAATPDTVTRGVVIQVAETLANRRRLATEIVKGVILPQFVILPLAVLLVWLALARGIAPLNDLQRRIRSRASGDLSPIDEREAPEEVSPLVAAINDLLGRLDQSIAAQKRFLADAAHQLKTPLAGLRMQAELAQREIDAGGSDPQAIKRSLQQIALASERAARMVNQLLAMARAENKEDGSEHQPVNLSALATETVHDFVPRAMDKRIDLGFEGPAPRPGAGPLTVQGNPLLLGELIRNLVENALQYTPAGGAVTVRVIDDPFGQVVVLQVEDSGPGIPAADREKVFQPFFRRLGTQVDGSGLGLAIVREIAMRHGVEVTLGDTDDRGRHPVGPGARFTLRFKATPALDGSAPR